MREIITVITTKQADKNNAANKVIVMRL